jgi:conjugative transposon TraM protein
MKDKLKISVQQKQQLKKYGVFALMAIVFAGSMWLIFAPSDADKEKQEQGFNADIPDPDGGGLIANKKDAYEQEQMETRRRERMMSLDGYIGMLEDGKKNELSGGISLNDETTDAVDAASSVSMHEKQAPIGGSVSAYKDINRSLGNFYEQSGDDPEKEQIKKRLEELETRLGTKDNTGGMDEQFALIEKSYELAAKYLPNGQNASGATGTNGSATPGGSGNGNVSGSDNNKAAPIRRIQNQTVSALAQDLSNEELIAMFLNERNTGFNTIGGEMGVSAKNTISAVIHDDQTVVDGQATRLRLTEPLMAGTTLIPNNTILTGVAKIQDERLNILISSVEYQGTIIPIEMTIYDSDGQRGIYIPESLEMNAVKEVVANMGNSVGTSFTITDDAGAQITSDLTKGAIQGVSQYMQKKIRQVKVHLKSGYRVMLMPKAN